jgi:hypothetical protein
MQNAPTSVLIPPTRTPLLGAMAALGAAFSFALAVMLLQDPSLTPGMKSAAAALGGLWGLGSALVAFRLLSARTGLFIDEGAGRVGVCITRPHDTWWFSKDRLAGAGTLAVATPGTATIERWIVWLGLESGVRIVIVESGSREFCAHVEDGLRARLSIAAEAPRPEPPSPGTATLGVRRGGALQALITAFGLALTLTGVLALGHIASEPVVGFLLGPLLALLGLTLLATALIKRFSTEHLDFDGHRWTHAFSLFGHRFGARSVRATEPGWRLHLAGARGAWLELVGDDGSLILGSSARALSRESVDALSRLPDAFTSKHLP